MKYIVAYFLLSTDLGAVALVGPPAFKTSTTGGPTPATVVYFSDGKIAKGGLSQTPNISLEFLKIADNR